mgnify:FL=1|tara:strand:+ start:2658 stop:3008 length:351 start_codon:yes stop_codon:yes gene_type:complete
MSLPDIFSPAIEYAEEGYAVTVKNAFFMDGASSRFSPTASKVMMSRGRTPLPGEVLIQKDLANTFRQIVRGGTDVFYRGEIAQKITEFSRQNGGLITKKDLEDFQVEWHDPISIPY